MRRDDPGSLRLLAALTFLPLAGCFSTPLGARYASEGIRQAPAATLDQSAASDLRIPASAVTRGSGAEVPLVPVPPVPIAAGPLPSTARPQQTAVIPAAAHAPAPLTEPSPAGTGNVRQVVQQAASAYAAIDSYIARLTRRELVNGKYEEELILFEFRKQPWSVYFKWLGDVGKGREVIFVKGQHGSQIHTLLAAGDHPLKPAGSRISLSPDSVFVRMASRHPVTEAGIGASIERLVALAEAVGRGDSRRGSLAFLGPQSRQDFLNPLVLLEHTVPPGVDPTLPRGGKRLYGFDPDNHLPVLVTTRDDKGQEVEYYRYDRLQYPVRLDDDDFNPDKVWGRPGGARNGQAVSRPPS